MSRAHGCAGATTYRIAVGPQAGRKVFALQTLPACDLDEFADTAGSVSGFSLHAGVAARSDERKKPERLCEGVPAVTSVGQPLRKSDFRLRQAATSATSGAVLGDTHSPGDKIRTDRLRANGQRWREKVVERYFNNTSILT